MNRNAESSFASLPAVSVGRSVFNIPSQHITTAQVGRLIPIYIAEYYPGDTLELTVSQVARLTTPVAPIFGNMYWDTFYFKVPANLCWDHFIPFTGENTESAWIPQTEYTMPTISSPPGGFQPGTIADYMGLPTLEEWSAEDPGSPTALPFRAYALICNEFFRSTELTDPLNIPKGDANQTGSNGDNYINDVANGGMPFKVAKYHDLFSSSAPGPQRAAPITFDLIAGGVAPVITGDEHITSYAGPSLLFRSGKTGGKDGIDWSHYSEVPYNVTSSNMGIGPEKVSSTVGAVPTNLWADLRNSLGSITIEELRLAFRMQEYFEKLTLYGSRYPEQCKAFFGITSPDARLGRPEYLGGSRLSINISQVVNTAQTPDDFLGDTGAMSLTSDVDTPFVTSCTEHGYIIGVGCLRYMHVYSQSLERFWTRKNWNEFYNPVFSNIGYTPVYKYEICANSETMHDGSVWGYNEAWHELRTKQNRVSGMMRNNHPQTLAYWHLADYYDETPTLSDEWLREDPSNVDRVITVSSRLADPFLLDYFTQAKWTRVLPMYSIPGLGSVL